MMVWQKKERNEKIKIKNKNFIVHIILDFYEERKEKKH